MTCHSDEEEKVAELYCKVLREITDFFDLFPANISNRILDISLVHKIDPEMTEIGLMEYSYKVFKDISGALIVINEKECNRHAPMIKTLAKKVTAKAKRISEKKKEIDDDF